MSDLGLLPGVPEPHIRRRLAAAGGNEVDSGKFSHPESSAALAVNAFGRFIEEPQLFPSLPGMADIGAARVVDIEFCAQFPWSGGRHPWLDAVVETATHLVGIESKRFEPFRDAKSGSFSTAYDRPVWGDAMGGYCSVRDQIRSGALRFEHLDAVQLVKHAFGLVTEARRRTVKPALFYIFAEPEHRQATPISTQARQFHRREIEDFARRVAGDEVTFAAGSYRDWINAWPATPPLDDHASLLVQRFDL